MERNIGHQGRYPGDEIVTDPETIPQQYRKTVSLPGGGSQIIDIRTTYNWEPGSDGKGGRFVECSSVWADAERDGFYFQENEREELTE